MLDLSQAVARQLAAVDAGLDSGGGQCAGEDGLGVQIARETKGGELRRRQVQDQTVFCLAQAAMGLQAIGAGLHIEVETEGRAALPLQAAAAVQGLPGKAAVVQMELAVELRPPALAEAALHVEASIEVGRREAAKTGRVEVVQLAAGRQAPGAVELQFAVCAQAGRAAAQGQSGQVEACRGQAPLGIDPEARVAEGDLKVLFGGGAFG